MKQTALPTIRHLVEVDDLRDSRDGELQPGQEPAAQAIAKELAKHIESHKVNKLVFIHSPKKRALATAQLTQRFLLEINPVIQIKYYSEPNLKDIHHGAYILPPTYKAGDFFEGFALADKIFYDEVFGEKNDRTENYTYRYGDPYPFEDGNYKYPELAKYFSKSGENFKEALIRIYSEVVKFAHDYDKYYEGYGPVVFSHGLPLEIYKDLSEVAAEVVLKDFTYPVGKLPRVCYQHHLERNSEEGSHGRADLLSLEHITNPIFLKMLEDEISYLKRLN